MTSPAAPSVAYRPASHQREAEVPSPWYAPGTEHTDAARRLFCLPYAGGNSAAFRDWQEHLGPCVQVVPIRMPGRLQRIIDPPIDRMPVLVEQLTASIRPLLDRPFAFFGISMGALIAFEAVRELRATGVSAERLIVASYPGPSEPPSEPPVGHLPDEEFVEALRVIGVAPPALLEHEELMRIMLPAIRADFLLTERHDYRPTLPLDLPITAIYGFGDPLTSATEMERWGRESTYPPDFITMPGGHFLLHEHPVPLLTAVSDRLAWPPARLAHLAVASHQAVPAERSRM
jgi:medium-chain acyl-[acyl-carrier-protein] hydrolase